MEITNYKKKVLHVLVHLGYGGIETWICEILTHYDNEKLQMDICLIGKNGDPGALFDRVKKTGSNVFIIPFKKPYKFWKEFENLAKNYEVIIIHTGVFLSPITLLRSKENYNQPRLIMLHNSRHSLPFKLFGLEENLIVVNLSKELFNKFNAISATRILSCSYAALNSNFRLLGKKKGEVISYGIDIEKFYPNEEISDLRLKKIFPQILWSSEISADFHSKRIIKCL